MDAHSFRAPRGGPPPHPQTCHLQHAHGQLILSPQRHNASILSAAAQAGAPRARFQQDPPRPPRAGVGVGGVSPVCFPGGSCDRRNSTPPCASTALVSSPWPLRPRRCSPQPPPSHGPVSCQGTTLTLGCARVASVLWGHHLLPRGPALPAPGPVPASPTGRPLQFQPLEPLQPPVPCS